MEKNESPIVSRTRERLVEVARQLFAYKGVENTTMGDIASASEKGRRTIYTYFKSKKEIYDSTIESDSDRVVSSLKRAVETVTTPEDRLRCFIMHRLDYFEMHRQGGLGQSIDAILHLDFNRIERVRKQAIVKEKMLLNEIISDGVNKGIFDGVQARSLMPVVQLILQGSDLSIARNNFELIDLDKESYKEVVVGYILNSLLTNKKTNQNETT